MTEIDAGLHEVVLQTQLVNVLKSVGRYGAYPQKIMSTGTLLRIHLQGKVEEVLEDGGQILLILNLRSSVGGNQPQGAERRLC